MRVPSHHQVFRLLLAGAKISLVAAATCAPLRIAVAGATAAGGFPAALPTATSAVHMTVARQAPSDSQDVLVVLSAHFLTVLARGGKVVDGFPVTFEDASKEGPTGAPVACDLEPGGTHEMAFAMAGGKSVRVLAYGMDGRSLAGFPVYLTATRASALSCTAGPQGKSLLSLTTNDGSFWQIDHKGAKRAVASVGAGVVSAASYASPTGASAPYFAITGGDGALHLIRPGSKGQTGGRYEAPQRLSAMPAIGDINDDGRADFVAVSGGYSLYAIDDTGKVLSGFPLAAGLGDGAPALVDLDQDHIPEIAYAARDGRVHAFDGHGLTLRGFPASLPGAAIGGLVAGDLNGDHKPELIVSTKKHITTISPNGVPFSTELPASVISSPVIADLDGDFRPEVYVATADQKVHGFYFARRRPSQPPYLPWPVEGHDATHSGRYGPSPATFRDLKLGAGDGTAGATVPLKVAYRYFDLDGDPEVKTQIRWYRDGKLVSSLNNLRQVKAKALHKGQHWYFTIQSGDDFADHPAKTGTADRRARLFRSPEIVISNAPPSAPAVRLGPKLPRSDTGLQVVFLRHSVDPDGDRVSYRYQWLRNGKPARIRQSEAKVKAGIARKNQRWEVIVTPHDGARDGPSARASTIVLNTAPTALDVSLSPPRPRSDLPLKIEIGGKQQDLDGDPITLSYAYWLNGVRLPLPPGTHTIPAEVLRKHQVGLVRVTVSDDQGAGDSTEVQFRVQNAHPRPPKIAILPKTPRTHDTLKAAILEQIPDADGDPITYKIQWFVDGRSVRAGVTVPSKSTRKGQQWQLKVTPNDGEISGKTVVANIRIGNSPPQQPSVFLDDYEPHAGQAIKPRFRAAPRDPDGDKTSLVYHWYVNGKPYKKLSNPGVLPAEAIRRGQRWKLSVAAHDGNGPGPSDVVHFRVKNSPPNAPKIALTPEAPTSSEGLAVQLTEPAIDPDGDKITYEYRWFRNGQPLTPKRKNVSTIDKARTRRDEHWRVEVRAYDGALWSPRARASVSIANHAPFAPTPVIAPELPRSRDTLRCTSTTAVADPDNDTVTYYATWFKNGKQMPATGRNTFLPASMTRAGERWACELEATDGSLSSKAKRSVSTTILNSPPSQPIVSITLTPSGDMRCAVDRVSYDADGQMVRYRFAWALNGHTLADGKASGAGGTIPAALTSAGQTWECHVTPSDGKADGREAVASMRLKNSPPSKPRIRFDPEAPVQGHPLTCIITTPSTDSDGDNITYHYAWMKNGVLQNFDNTRTKLEKTELRGKDKWRCAVTPTDGKSNGETARTRDVVVPGAR